jgi:hypothetical protein
MSNPLSNDIRAQYDKALATIQKIVEAFPEDRWLVPHGDEWYIPCRLAYHLAVSIDGQIGGGYRDADFASNLPFGSLREATAETLPAKKDFIPYLESAIARAQNELAALEDDVLIAPLEEQRAWMGTSQIALYLYFLRELSVHSGELNKMLVENGIDDIWVTR